MYKSLLALSLVVCLAPSAFAAMTLEAVAEGPQVVSGSSVNQNLGQVSVSLQHISQPERTRVFHPNGKGQLSEDFSPYVYKNIVDTHVFRLTIQNNEGQTLNADQLNLQVSLNGMPYDYLDRDNMMKQWRHYYYLNTNTISGAPDFMEQERAIVAENYISKNGFQAQDVPPGGQISGYIAVPALQQSGVLKFRLRHLGNSRSPQDFVFRFNAQQQG